MDLSSQLKTTKVSSETIEFLKNPFTSIPSIKQSINLSLKYNLALHPKYLFYWSELSCPKLIVFLENLKNMNFIKRDENDFKIEIVNNEFKKLFEILGICHIVQRLKIEDIKNDKSNSILIIDKYNTESLFANLGYLEFFNKFVFNKENFISQINKIIKFTQDNLEMDTFTILTKLNKVEIRDKAGTYIGCRMGRPEKAKLRKMDGRPHGLFPVGADGGRMKNVIEALKNGGKIETYLEVFYDKQNECESIYKKTLGQDIENEDMYFERFSKKTTTKDAPNSVKYKKFEIDLKKYIDEVRNILKTCALPKMVKGVESVSNKNKTIEHLAKLFLREKNKVFVNKDGTIRYDMIEMGLTHFRPIEIGTSLDKLKELGYTHDYLGCELKDENQLLEIYPQDVILPNCKQGVDEDASDFIINTANFVDEELEKLYGIKPFYNFKNIADTIGHLVIGLAPHTSAGIVGRIIGYTATQGCFSNPIWHAAQRRNLDGDENGIMLLLDGLINFSKEYLPNRRGTKTMDTSLVLTTNLHLDQIDDEVYGMDIVENYDLDFYKKAKLHTNPKKIKSKKVVDKLTEKTLDKTYFGYHFTHNVKNLNNTVVYSSYKSVPNMTEKLNLQLKIGTKIRAVNENEVGGLIIDKHFLKDIKGNLRKFSMQKFRCGKCNEIYRRPPLNGKCRKCGNPNIIFTISEGSIKKYVTPCFNIIRDYDISPYLQETMELLKLRIEEVFGKEKPKEKTLSKYF